MFGDLTNIPTDTLLDMVFAILKTERLLTSAEIAELQQIQSELKTPFSSCLRSGLELTSG
jgi:hypothetical protein